MPFSRILGISLLLSALYGCSHPLEIWGTGKGDIDSQSGTRNCTLEEFQEGASNCAENYVVGAYDETYTAVARTGSLFHRWASACISQEGVSCSFKVGSTEVKEAWGQTVPPLRAIFRSIWNSGFNSLFVGDDFFDPIARGIAWRISESSIYQHSTTSVFAPGAAGAPLALWNDPVLAPQIKASLDGGNFDVFGMTFHPSYATAEGYRNWVNYALEKNPDTRFFIATPWAADPELQTLAQYEAAFDALQVGTIQPILDTLRGDHPGVDFYEIPYGRAAVELRRLWEDGTLASNGDVSALVGSAADAVFSDASGQPGEILEELGALVWMGAIYGEDGLYYDYEEPYFATQLQSVARNILETQDVNYKAPPETFPDTDGDMIANPYDPDDDNDGVLDALDLCPLLPPNELGNGCPFSSTVVRASVSTAGVEGDSLSWRPEISDDGRYVVFQSNASQLVPADTNSKTDIFVRDLQNGTTERVSLNSSGAESILGGGTFNSSISGDGRFVAFSSHASDFVANDTNGKNDVFLRDRVSGTTVRVSVDSAGNEADDSSASSNPPAVSDDGRYVAFTSRASNLVGSAVSDYRDIYRHDTQTGTTIQISVTSAGVSNDRYSGNPDMSADGRYVAFESSATNFIPGDTGIYSDIFLRDTQTGLTTHISVPTSGTFANSSSVQPSVSADGRYIAFQSAASNLVPNDTNNHWDIFHHDTHTSITTRVSVSSAGEQGTGGNSTSGSQSPSISADGRYVGFTSGFSNLTPGNYFYSVGQTYVHDTQTGTTSRVGTNPAGDVAPRSSDATALSGDGSLVVFQSNADHFVDGDTNEAADVFVRRVH